MLRAEVRMSIALLAPLVPLALVVLAAWFGGHLPAPAPKPPRRRTRIEVKVAGLLASLEEPAIDLCWAVGERVGAVGEGVLCWAYRINREQWRSWRAAQKRDEFLGEWWKEHKC
jgi:hypothetical protein